jgi:hypothetical protein
VLGFEHPFTGETPRLQPQLDLAGTLPARAAFLAQGFEARTRPSLRAPRLDALADPCLLQSLSNSAWCRASTSIVRLLCT